MDYSRWGVCCCCTAISGHGAGTAGGGGAVLNIPVTYTDVYRSQRIWVVLSKEPTALLEVKK